MQPYLAGIFIYPVKYLDRVSLTQATVLESGALQHDREFAIFDQQGLFFNGKHNAKVHSLRSLFDNDLGIVSVQVHRTNHQAVFHIHHDRIALEAWLSDHYGLRVKFVQNSVTGFPNDTNAVKPTVISRTIEQITSWFPELSLEETRLRLRANLEIARVPPFWEDQLFAQPGQCIQFQVGEVLFKEINPNTKTSKLLIFVQYNRRDISRLYYSLLP